MNRALWLLLCGGCSPALACGPLSPDVQASVQRSAKTFGIDQGLLRALLWTESHFCTNAVSPVGALGLGQLMPKTAAALGVDPHDPHQNVYGAARYLRQMWDQFQNWTHALAAYNAGPGAVQRYQGVPPYAETQAYVRKVLGVYPHFAAGATVGPGRGVPVAAGPAPARPPAGPKPPLVTPPQASRAQATPPPRQSPLPRVRPSAPPVAVAEPGPRQSLIIYSAAQPPAKSSGGGLIVFDAALPR
ncbi:lytic transglycosylase domain-containing protein [Deinococcus planocerae]|uniref:lytic transglycosylase domain-containing protein n=1 Tax=Deinococcus planocerae TaxID=1737569 RepID=UPI000C7F0447|nr:lytic transglycosylase domain-containing protein [Deinococcus planocerae]